MAARDHYAVRLACVHARGPIAATRVLGMCALPVWPDDPGSEHGGASPQCHRSERNPGRGTATLGGTAALGLLRLEQDLCRRFRRHESVVRLNQSWECDGGDREGLEIKGIRDLRRPLCGTGGELAGRSGYYEPYPDAGRNRRGHLDDPESDHDRSTK